MKKKDNKDRKKERKNRMHRERLGNGNAKGQKND